MVKKAKVLVILLLAVILTACGGQPAKGKKESKNKAAEVTIDKAFFIEPFGGDNDDDAEYLAIALKVKNTSDSKMNIWDESFYLVEDGDDEKISTVRLDYESRMKEFMGDVASGKSISGTVVFKVESSKKYILNFNSGGYTEDGTPLEEIELALEPAEYEESKKALEEPQKALQAYIDVVFLQKENADFEKLIASEAEAEIEMVKKEYINHLKDTFYKFRPSDAQYDDAFESFVANQREAVELELTTVGYVGEAGQVKVEYVGISDKGVYDLISEYRTEYLDKSDDYDSEKSEEYAFSKLEDVYADAEVGEPRDDLAVTLTKKDDKWVVDFKSDETYENKYLLRAFLGDVD